MELVDGHGVAVFAIVRILCTWRVAAGTACGFGSAADCDGNDIGDSVARVFGIVQIDAETVLDMLVGS